MAECYAAFGSPRMEWIKGIRDDGGVSFFSLIHAGNEVQLECENAPNAEVERVRGTGKEGMG